MAKQTITGLKELAKELEKLGKDVREKDMTYATRKGAQRIQESAKSKAPRDTGRLIDNIVVRKDKNTLFDSEYLVGVRKTGKKDNPKNAFYAYFVEYGHDTRPSKSSTKRKHRTKAIGSGNDITAHPFMRPAWEETHRLALDEFKHRISKRVAMRKKQAAKL